jgi:hypothetical protein
MKRIYKSLLLAICLVLGANWASAETRTVAPIATVLDASQPDVALYDASATSWKIHATKPKNGSFVQNYGMIAKFDMTDLAEMSFKSARIKFHVMGDNPSYNDYLRVATINTDWDAETATWNNTNPTLGLKDLNVGEDWYPKGSNNAGRDYDYDITEAVKADEDKLIGLAIYLNNGRSAIASEVSLEVEYIDAASATTFTLKYVDGNGNELKSETVDASAGSAIELSASQTADFKNEDGTKKYIYVSNDAEGKTAAADGSTVITVVYREAAIWGYTLNAVDGESNFIGFAAQGTVFEKDNAKAAYSRYFVKDGVLYEAPKTDDNKKQYNYTFAVPEDNTIQNLTCNAKEVTDALFFTEAEDVKGLTISTTANVLIRGSHSASAYAAEEDVRIVTLGAGTYKFTVGVFDTSKYGDKGDFYFTDGENVVFNAKSSAGNLSETTSGEIVLEKTTTIYLQKGGGQEQSIDYILITGNGSIEEDVPEFDPAALIANPAFAATPIDNGICTYAKDVEANGTTYSGMQAVPGWNFGVENGDARAAGVFAIGGEPFLGGKGYQAPAVGPNGETAGNVLGLVAVWDATVQYVTDEVTLVPGSYKLTIPVYNSVGGTNTPQKGLFGFIANNGTEYLAAASAYTVGEWKNEVITFIIEEETTGKFSLGYDMTNVGSGSAPHLFIGGLTLEYKSILDGAIEAYNIAMNAANEAAADEIVTGVEKQALSDVIAANANIDIASVDAIIAATNALNAAVATFNAAKAAYIQLNDTKTLANTEGWPYASAEKKAVVENAKSAVAASAEDATAKAAELLKAYRQFIESNATAEGVEGAIDMTSVIVNPLSQDALNGWTLTGKANIKENEPWTDGSDVAVHKYFDSDQWGDSSWDITLAQDITLNKGKYVLSAISRGSGNVDMKLFAGEAATKLTVIGSTGGVFNRGWNDHFVTFEVTEDNTTVNIGVNGVANNAHEWMSFSNFRLACIEAAEPASPYGIIWDNGEKTQEDEYSIITLNGALFKGLKAGDIVRANFTVGANARAAQPAKIIKTGEISIFVNDVPVYEVKDIAQGTEKMEFALNEQAIPMLDMMQTLTLKYKNIVMSTIELVEGEPAVDELLNEAEELAADAEAVAVGKLLAAIEAYKADANAELLQAAIAQFKEDNKDQESDQTAKVATNGWMKFDGTPAGVCATQYAPAITTYDGRTAQLAEVYETTAETVGTIIYQDITGLTNGKYKVGFYGNAFYTPGRGISSTMEDGAEDVAYVFANNEKAFITAHITTETTENDFRQFDVEVTDGTIKLGMGKEQAGTNWHTMQIYQLTWFTSAKEVYANDKAAMQAAIAAAKAQAADPNKSEGKDELNTAIAAAEAALQSNMLNIAEFEAQIQALNAAVADYKKANQFIFDGVAYIIDTESGKMVAAGHDWGTRAIVNETGLDLTFTSNAETRTVTIDTQVSNGGDNHFLGSNLYTDAAAYGWILEYQGFGFYIGNGEQYLNIDANDNLVMSATPREWIIVTADGVMEERMGELAKATAENGVDATFLLKNPNFNRNDLRVSAWQVSEDCTNKNLNGGNNVNNCAESYHSTFTISQLVENAPKGLYKLTAQGYYRQDGEEAEAAPKFFIGDATAEVPAQTGTEGNMAAASESFTAGLYTIEPIEFVFNGEELTVGVTGTAANQWVVFDNFRLTYYGPKTVGISELTSDKSQNAKAIYNLNGQKVQHMTKGLYIRDGKKVLVK